MTRPHVIVLILIDGGYMAMTGISDRRAALIELVRRYAEGPGCYVLRCPDGKRVSVVEAMDELGFSSGERWSPARWLERHDRAAA
jgi:hypothetical protein